MVAVAAAGGLVVEVDPGDEGSSKTVPLALWNSDCRVPFAVPSVSARNWRTWAVVASSPAGKLTPSFDQVSLIPGPPSPVRTTQPWAASAGSPGPL